MFIGIVGTGPHAYQVDIDITIDTELLRNLTCHIQRSIDIQFGEGARRLYSQFVANQIFYRNIGRKSIINVQTGKSHIPHAGNQFIRQLDPVIYQDTALFIVNGFSHHHPRLCIIYINISHTSISPSKTFVAGPFIRTSPLSK